MTIDDRPEDPCAISGDRALEHRMAETLDNLEELALLMSAASTLAGMEVLGVIPTTHYDPAAPASAGGADNVVDHPTRKR